MSPQSEQLKVYVKNCLQNGMSEQDVRNILLQSNWPEETVNEAFSLVDTRDQGTIRAINPNESDLIAHTSRPKYSTKVIIIVSIVLVVGLGLYIGQFLINNSDKSQQSSSMYERPPAPSDWIESTLPFDDKTFSFAHPSDWKIINRYNEPSGAYSDLRVVTSDYQDVSSFAEIEKKGIVSEGAVFDISITHYDGDLKSYKKGITNGTAGTLTLNISGFENLEEVPIKGRPALTYIAKTNFIRTVAIMDGPYLVTFEYFQPYEISNSGQQPDLKDTHLEQLHLFVASFGSK